MSVVKALRREWLPDISDLPGSLSLGGAAQVSGSEEDVDAHLAAFEEVAPTLAPG